MEGWLGLAGVAVGFALGEGSRYLRYRFRIRRLKGVLRSEAQSLLNQIGFKRDIIRQALAVMAKQDFLPTLAVRSITTGYDEYFGEVYEHLTDLERNCLHNIYQRVTLA